VLRALGADRATIFQTILLSRSARYPLFWASPWRGVGGGGRLFFWGFFFFFFFFLRHYFARSADPLRPLAIYPAPLAEAGDLRAAHAVCLHALATGAQREHPRGDPFSGCMDGPARFPSRPRYVAGHLADRRAAGRARRGGFNGSWWLTLFWTLGGNRSALGYSRCWQLLVRFPLRNALPFWHADDPRLAGALMRLGGSGEGSGAPVVLSLGLGHRYWPPWGRSTGNPAAGDFGQPCSIVAPSYFFGSISERPRCGGLH